LSSSGRRPFTSTCTTTAQRSDCISRHDIFFDIEETLSWMKALPRMEAHILDGPHFLLETHSAECAELMAALIGRIERMP